MGIVFYQLFDAESSTFTYLWGDVVDAQAVLIDPVAEKVDRDLRLVEELGLNLALVLDTHVHADHISGAGEIRRRTGVKTAVSAQAQVDCADVALEDGQEIAVGQQRLLVLSTPGHTDGCLSFWTGDRVFTGDTLLIRGTGRTDFQNGSAARLYTSIQRRLYTLGDDTLVYPGHDYKGQTHSTIGLEKKFNARIPQTCKQADFERTMASLKLDLPRKIHEAVPANLACGKKTA